MTPDPAATADPQATAEPTPAPTSTPFAPPPVHLTIKTDAPAAGRSRIDPGAGLLISVGLTPDGALPASRLAVGIPLGWSVVDAGDGVFDVSAGRVAWDLDAVGAGVSTARRLSVRAPATLPGDGAGLEATFDAALEVSGSVVVGPSVTVLVAPLVRIAHVTLGRVPDLTLAPAYEAEDVALTDVGRFDMVRLRFQIRNGDGRAVSISPRLEVRRRGVGAFQAVPDHGSVGGLPFYVGSEWMATGRAGGGTELGPDAEAIPVGALWGNVADEPLSKSPGLHSMGPNPSASLSLPASTWSEVEFSIRPTTDATYLEGYEFRITDAGTDLEGAVTANLWMGAEPPLQASPIQYPGTPVGPASEVSPARMYALQTPVAVSAAIVIPGPNPGTHGPYGIAADQCAACHSTHAAPSPYTLVAARPPGSTLCFGCHDTLGTGATTKVEAQYTDPAVPANAPETGSYYRHDASVVDSGHTSASIDEFGGVDERHSDCVDCHDPHTTTGAPSEQTADGWTAPGQLTSISGVSAANGDANTAPVYTLLDGATTKVTLEYQLCLKCHSGWTTLPADDPDHPSWWAEDKGVELNPANVSFHPIEAPGKNQSQAMANSLSGTSPYKLWSFSVDSTIRCVNCHGDSRKFDTTSPPDAGSDLAPHANPYRGNLMQNYRDRDLKAFFEPYRSTDFALCYMCHAEAPFSDGTGNQRVDTNYRYHGKHLTGIRNHGAVEGDIDTAAAGRGDAICAECHFRIHSNANAGDFRPSTQIQTGTDAGLVNFAPNVTANVGLVEWNRTSATSGNCTLTCHGYSHEDAGY